VKQVGFKPEVKEGVMDEQSGETEWEEMMGEVVGESELVTGYQNEVDEEIGLKGVDSRDRCICKQMNTRRRGYH